MSPEGHLNIDVYRHGQDVSRVDIISNRPLEVAKLFEGRAPEDALSMLRLVFRVCVWAQSFAAARACEKAVGIETAKETIKARQLVVLSENVRELLLRLLVEWPRILNISAPTPNVKPIMLAVDDMSRAVSASGDIFSIGARPALNQVDVQAVIQMIRDYLTTCVFGENLETWREIHTKKDLLVWASLGHTPVARIVTNICSRGWEGDGAAQPSFLPTISDNVLKDRLHRRDTMAFIAHPKWNDVSCETTSLCRQLDQPLVAALFARHGTGLITRIVARLAELARIPDQMSVLMNDISDGSRRKSDVRAQPDGEGLAQVEAARGRLVHLVKIKDQKIVRYRILAPTEWNFQSDGAMGQGLMALRAENAEEFELKAHLFVNAIDPCVGYELKVH